VPVPFRALDEATQVQMHELVCASETGKLDQAAFCERASRLFDADPRHVAASSDAYLLGAFPGAVELLDELMGSGYETACLSNTNANHWSIMLDPSSPSALPLDRLTYRFASQEIGLRKPDEAIYVHVERVSGKRGNQIVFFDDLEANVAAAQRRGWRAHQIRIDADPIEQVRAHLRGHGILR
jgi:glucose-1-phosphatase